MNNEIKIAQTLTQQKFEDTVCSGFEGGITYWASCDATEDDTPETALSGVERGTYCHERLARGQVSIQLEDLEGEDPIPVLTRAKLLQGLQLMADKYPNHFADIVRETGDAATGDILIQLAVFGELVYG